MEQLNLLCGYLLAIYHYGKNIHHQVSGESFQAMHELADTIANNKYDTMDYFDYIDTIKEELIAGNLEQPPLEEEFMQIALQLMPQYAQGDQENFVQYLRLISQTGQLINQITQDMDLGDNSRLGDLAKDLKQYTGLIFLQVRGYLEQKQTEATQQEQEAAQHVPSQQQPQGFIQRLAQGFGR